MTVPLVVAIGTMHGKEVAIAPPLARLGIAALVPIGLDTDAFGTFTGEVARTGSMLDAARQKARAACKLTGLDVGIGSEGSFGPRPDIPLLPLGREVIVFWERTTGREIVEQVVDEQPAFLGRRVANIDDLDALIARTDFPATSLVVSPVGDDIHAKGLRTLSKVIDTTRWAIAKSQEGLALVQTDMRANHNPRRMRTICLAAEALAKRLSTHCPRCGSYGWGLVGVERGLPCSICGTPTGLVSLECHGCTACEYAVSSVRSDGIVSADAANCPNCNP
ncbi:MULTISPECIES: DUF6671 family protein [unclassified Devosia]|uniref:DUF6671 family protein n=1 Tax=unclassified Devosia TaxID=196773 RepID=UPI000AA8E3F9|nr:MULTISPECIES: DUF6671 family protein [unclassified Devosia]MBN9360856.1 hypothetical protein [Devosia sp.]